jgi:GT2 family glycosyltransferase
MANTAAQPSPVPITPAFPIDVTVVVVSYNTREMTLACLKSVVAQTRSARYEIVVVDNNSTDGSADAIRATFPSVRLIQPGQNLGFAGANNTAMIGSTAARLLLLNPDTLILDGAIDKLFSFAEDNPTLGIWGGRTVFADGSLNPRSCWRQMNLWILFCSLVGLSLFRNSPLFYSEGYGGWPRDTIKHVDIVTGCFFLIDRRLWERLRGFDPTFFMYGEEADLCLRAAKLGAQPTVTPTATIVHYGGASEKSRADKMIKMLAGKVTLMRRHWAASLSGGQQLRRRADVWRSVWLERDIWSKGWPEKPRSELPPPLFEEAVQIFD